MLVAKQEEGILPGNFFYHIGDGYQYHKCAEDVNGTTYFRCVQAESGCKGRASQDAHEFRHISSHCHDGDLLYPEVMILKRKLLARCKLLRLNYLTFKSIIDYELTGAHPEVSARINVRQLWTILQRTIHSEANAQ